jgi:ADP-heptose:LPS heptosyltransferase
MSPPNSEKKPVIRSMLVIHQGALGDFILALPALEILRKTFPQAKSVIMGYPRILELVKDRFYAEEILSIDQQGMATFFVRDGKLNVTLSDFFSQFDLIVVFGKDEGGPLIRNLKRASQGQILQINPFPVWDQRMHLTDHLLRELSRYGFSISETKPRLFLNERDQVWGKNFWKRKGLTMEESEEVIVLHPGSGSKKKAWPWGRFVNLVNFFQKLHGLRILIVLGPAEGPEIRRAFEGREWEMGDNAPILAKGLSLVELASAMAGSRLFIGNDSGISHMAASLGLPTVAIFGPTDPKVWSPRGEKVFVVRKEIPCSPCPQERFFQCQHLECLTGIRIEDVLSGVKRVGLKV